MSTHTLVSEVPQYIPPYVWTRVVPEVDGLEVAQASGQNQRITILEYEDGRRALGIPADSRTTWVVRVAR